MTLLDEIKIRIEVSDTAEYDQMVQAYINSGINYLANNKIPLLMEDDANYGLYVDFLDNYVTKRFEKDLSSTQIELMNEIMSDNLWNLKVIFDV